MLQRPDGAWAPPGGLVEASETPIQAAIRETFEETGLEVAGEPEPLNDYTWDARRLHVYQFIAPAQQGEVVLSDEHQAFRWLELEVIEAQLSSPSAAASPEAERILHARRVALTRARQWLSRQPNR